MAQMKFQKVITLDEYEGTNTSTGLNSYLNLNQTVRAGQKYLLENLRPDAGGVDLNPGTKMTLTIFTAFTSGRDRFPNSADFNIDERNIVFELEGGGRSVYRKSIPRRSFTLNFGLFNDFLFYNLRNWFTYRVHGSNIVFEWVDFNGDTRTVRWTNGFQFSRASNGEWSYEGSIILSEEI